jgi:hypothetical protein
VSDPTVDRYISRRGQNYRLLLPQWIANVVAGGRRYVGTYRTLEEAKQTRDQILTNLPEDEPRIEGLTTRDDIDVAAAWERAFEAQDQALRRTQTRARQTITMPDGGPFAIAYTSDWHIGDPACDYRTLKADHELIRDTPGMYAIFTGDGWNNWIIGKLQVLQRDEAIPFDEEVALFCDVVGTVGRKWLVAIPGNHANWTRLLAGIDRVREAFSHTKVLYDPYEVVFTLCYGEDRVVVKARHKWRWSSIFNATHGIETSWQRCDHDFDIGIGGHTHIGTFCRPFVRHKRKRWAVLVGTYKIDGDYGRERGLPTPSGRGAGAHVFQEGKLPIFIEDLETAADFLAFLRKRA